MNSSECELVSPRQLAKRSGWTERRIRGLIAENELRHIRVGGSILVPSDALEEFLKLNMVEPRSVAQSEVTAGVTK
jgi:excisionase family DNA binding protein